MPALLGHERRILDVGCGIGQFFASALPNADTAHAADVLAVGLDIDMEALAYGRKRFTQPVFLKANGDALPLADGCFDLVVCRVSLPYMNIPSALTEFNRVLRPGGRVWLSLHDAARTWSELWLALQRLQPKDVLFRGYVLLNGLMLHATGRTFAFPGLGRSESFQTSRGIGKALQRAGFEQLQVEHQTHFIATAVKPAQADVSGQHAA